MCGLVKAQLLILSTKKEKKVSTYDLLNEKQIWTWIKKKRKRQLMAPFLYLLRQRCPRSMTPDLDFLVKKLSRNEYISYIKWNLPSRIPEQAACLERQWMGPSCPNVLVCPFQILHHYCEV